jgi:hypothetical protein
MRASSADAIGGRHSASDMITHGSTSSKPRHAPHARDALVPTSVCASHTISAEPKRANIARLNTNSQHSMGTHGEPCRLRAAGGGGVSSGRASRARALAMALVSRRLPAAKRHTTNKKNAALGIEPGISTTLLSI